MKIWYTRYDKNEQTYLQLSDVAEKVKKKKVVLVFNTLHENTCKVNYNEGTQVEKKMKK